VRFFAVEGVGTRIARGPLRVVSEYVGGGNLREPIGLRNDLDDVTEAELLALDGGPEALERWRLGDDSAHARAMLDELAIDALDDELSGRG
jgi:hypothetical protein